MMIYNNVLDQIISELQPEDLPAEYIVMAKVIDFDGNQKIIRGPELEKFMNNPNKTRGFLEARVILNVKKIREDILTDFLYFFEILHKDVENLINEKDF